MYYGQIYYSTGFGSGLSIWLALTDNILSTKDQIKNNAFEYVYIPASSSSSFGIKQVDISNYKGKKYFSMCVQVAAYYTSIAKMYFSND